MGTHGSSQENVPLEINNNLNKVTGVKVIKSKRCVFKMQVDIAE